MIESRLAEETFFRPVRPGNAFEDTVQRLLQTIRLGVVAPGESLPSERDLAVRLGVSRDTVRDALRSLGEAGYVVARRGCYGGTFVADELPHPEPHGSPGQEAPDAADLEEVLALREVLEVGAARLAASRTLSAPERDLVWRALEEVTGADPADYRRLDSRLHLVVAEITLLERNIAHSDEQHRTLVTAILACAVGAPR